VKADSADYAGGRRQATDPAAGVDSSDQRLNFFLAFGARSVARHPPYGTIECLMAR
jgi:hypothetical protein